MGAVGGRKVKLKITDNSNSPGTGNKKGTSYDNYSCNPKFEILPSSTGSSRKASSEIDPRECNTKTAFLLTSPGGGLANRRFSDSHQSLIKPTISVSLVDDDNNVDGNDPASGSRRKRANSYSPLSSNDNINNDGLKEDIVCSTGELINLKCLSSSAVEMRSIHKDLGLLDDITDGGAPGGKNRRGSMFQSGKKESEEQHHRSRSFDASILHGVRKFSVGGTPVLLSNNKGNIFSGWFNRIRAVGNNNNNNSSSNNNSPLSPPYGNVSMSSSVVVTDSNGSGASTLVATSPPNDHVKYPSPTSTTPIYPTNYYPQDSATNPLPSATPNYTNSSSLTNNNDKTNDKVIPWDNKTGYFLDASLLGLAIENHLKKGDVKGKRRATFCTLTESSTTLLGGQCGQSPDFLGVCGPNASGNQPPSQRRRSASAYSVIPFFSSSNPQSSSQSQDPQQQSRRRESIASMASTRAVPASSTIPSTTNIMTGNGSRRSSFSNRTNEYIETTSTLALDDNYSAYSSMVLSPPNDNDEDVIVGSFIKTSMTSELYSEGEVIIEEEDSENDLNDFNQVLNSSASVPNDKKNGQGCSGGIDFATFRKKPAETIINLFGGTTSNTGGSSKVASSPRFSSLRGSCASGNPANTNPINNAKRGSRDNVDIERSDVNGDGHNENGQSRFTICGFVRNLIMQFINSFIR